MQRIKTGKFWILLLLVFSLVMASCGSTTTKAVQASSILTIDFYKAVTQVEYSLSGQHEVIKDSEGIKEIYEKFSSLELNEPDQQQKNELESINKKEEDYPVYDLVSSSKTIRIILKGKYINVDSKDYYIGIDLSNSLLKSVNKYKITAD